MKTTVKYKTVFYKEYKDNDINVISCTVFSEIHLKNVKNVSSFLNIREVKTYLRKFNIDDNGVIVIKTIGIARCSPEDFYDFEIGRKIALTRAQEQAFIQTACIYDEILKRVNKDISITIVNCFETANKCFEHSYVLSYGNEAFNDDDFEKHGAVLTTNDIYYTENINDELNI